MSRARENPRRTLRSFSGREPGDRRTFHDTNGLDLFRRVVWAVDASPTEFSLNLQAARAMKPLLRAEGSSILPIYALDPEGLSWSGATASERTESLRPAAEASLTRSVDLLAHRAGLETLSRPLILELSDVPLSGAVRALARKVAARAQRLSAELIVVSHHGRSGLSRLLQPSFTELILSESRLPALIVTPQAQVPRHRYGDLIFPVDSGADVADPAGIGHDSAFHSAVRLAASLGTRLRLVYQPRTPLEPVVQSGLLALGGGWVPLSGLYNSGLPSRFVERSTVWAKAAAQAKVPFEIASDDTGRGFASSLREFCRVSQDPLLVIGAGESLLDDVATAATLRDTLREAPCPVLVLRG